jgi:hypothetical protein
MTQLSTITKSWKAFVSHKWLSVLAVLVNAVFVFILAQLHYVVFSKASEYALTLTGMISEQAQNMAETSNIQNLSVLSSTEFIEAYNQLLKFIGIFIACAIAAWLVCEGIMWFLAHKTVDRKFKAVDFALKFSGMTLFWFIGFALLTIIAINLLDYAATSVFPMIGVKTANIIAILLYWALAYFMFISYAIAPHNVLRQTFALGTKHWKELITVHLLGTLVFALSAYIPILLMKFNPYLPIIFWIVISLPALAWMRVLWVSATEKVIGHGQD